VAVGALSDDLLRLPGVEHAELDGDPATPAGIRVRVADGVDAAAVADEVRRVLAQHGLRPDIGDASDASPPGSDTHELVPGPPQDTPDDAPPDPIADVPVVVLMAGNGPISVGITEGIDTIVVTATGPAGHASVPASGPSAVAVDQAVTEAVAELAGTATRPRICSIDERELGGISVVTVVIEESGARLVGSAVVRSGRTYAVGRAVWAALSSR